MNLAALATCFGDLGLANFPGAGGFFLVRGLPILSWCEGGCLQCTHGPIRYLFNLCLASPQTCLYLPCLSYLRATRQRPHRRVPRAAVETREHPSAPAVRHPSSEPSTHRGVLSVACTVVPVRETAVKPWVCLALCDSPTRSAEACLVASRTMGGLVVTVRRARTLGGGASFFRGLVR